MADKIQLYENQPIRTAWVEDEEEWYFSIVDVVQVLTESNDGRKYWNKLKQRLKEEGSQLVTNCHQFKMTARDGKKRMTDVANTEQLLRIVQSIPSKKAEPFKMWLAEATTTELTKAKNPNGLNENREVAREGGTIAGNARKEIEERTGQPVITSKSAKQLQNLVTGMIEGVVVDSEDNPERGK